MCCHSSHPSRERRACGCESEGRSHFAHPSSHHHYPDPSGSGFGVRRPLRFLAWKLELDEAQIEILAAILNDLKTERAQAAVDDRRALGLLADAAAGEGFDCEKAGQALKLRTESGANVQRQVIASLERMHALLRPEQRARLAYLLRTGTLSM